MHAELLLGAACGCDVAQRENLIIEMAVAIVVVAFRTPIKSLECTKHGARVGIRRRLHEGSLDVRGMSKQKGGRITIHMDVFQKIGFRLTARSERRR